MGAVSNFGGASSTQVEYLDSTSSNVSAFELSLWPPRVRFFIPNRTLSSLVGGSIFTACAVGFGPHIPLVVDTTKQFWGDYWSARKAAEITRSNNERAAKSAEEAVERARVRSAERIALAQIARDRSEARARVATEQRRLDYDYELRLRAQVASGSPEEPDAAQIEPVAD